MNLVTEMFELRDIEFLREFRDLEANLVDDGWTHQETDKYFDYLSTKRRQGRGRTTPTNKDAQRSKVYRAERKFAVILRQNNKLRTFDSLDAAQARADEVVRSMTFLELGGDPVVKIKHMKNTTHARTAGAAYYNSKLIQLHPRYGMDEYLLLHELTHLAGRPTPNTHHDVGFRADLIELVRTFIGKKYAKILEQLFRDANLKVTREVNVMNPNKWLKRYRHMQYMKSQQNKDVRPLINRFASA